MTYCVGILLNEGIVLASDSRTHAGVDNFATFCKMTVFERPGDRVIVLLSSGNLAGTQSVISVLRQRGEAPEGHANSIWNARTMFDVAVIVSDAVRDVERRDAASMADSPHLSTPRSSSAARSGARSRDCSALSQKATSSRRERIRPSSRPARRSTANPSSIGSSHPRPVLATR